MNYLIGYVAIGCLFAAWFMAYFDEDDFRLPKEIPVFHIKAMITIMVIIAWPIFSIHGLIRAVSEIRRNLPL